MSITSLLISAQQGDPVARAELDRQMAAATADKNAMKNAAGEAGAFANQGQAGYGDMTGALAGQRQFFNDMMQGKNSVATEQLRQGLQQQQAAQQSMAAGASPQNSVMASRNAAMNMGRNQTGMVGQAALAQLAERQMAAQQLSDLNLGQRGQDMQVALGSRQNQMTGLQPKPSEPGMFDKALAAGATYLGMRAGKK